MSKELLEWPFQQRMETLHNTPGYMLFVRFAAFRDIELKYFANLESPMSTSKYHRIAYADHLHLQNRRIISFLTFSARGELWNAPFWFLIRHSWIPKCSLQLVCLFL